MPSVIIREPGVYRTRNGMTARVSWISTIEPRQYQVSGTIGTSVHYWNLSGGTAPNGYHPWADSDDAVTVTSGGQESSDIVGVVSL